MKWHFKTKQGIKNFTREQADEMRGKDPDYAQRDLFEAIAKGDFPKWRVCVQIMPEKEQTPIASTPSISRGFGRMEITRSGKSVSLRLIVIR